MGATERRRDSRDVKIGVGVVVSGGDGGAGGGGGGSDSRGVHS